jgi:hypothetical protein
MINLAAARVRRPPGKHARMIQPRLCSSSVRRGVMVLSGASPAGAWAGVWREWKAGESVGPPMPAAGRQSGVQVVVVKGDDPFQAD